MIMYGYNIPVTNLSFMIFALPLEPIFIFDLFYYVYKMKLIICNIDITL